MSVRGRVFGSGEERDYYYHLAEQWGEDWRVYHNLPYLMVFDLGPLKNSLSGREQSRLKKTSIDYTLCDAEDRPLLSVEFDGLAQGFNVGDEYRVPGHSPAPSRWREEIMSLKLRVAHACDFPLFVVGSSMFEQITDDLRLTLVDGIIGTVLANRVKKEKIPEYLEDRVPDESEALSEWERWIIADEITGLEVQTEIDYNPLTRERSRRATEVARRNSIDSIRTESVFSPPLPEVEGFPDLETARERLEEMKGAKFVGSRVTLEDTEHDDVSATAWIPNFDTPYFDALGADLPEDVAFLLACEKLEALRAEN